MTEPFSFALDLRTHNPLNGQHGHWAVKANLRKLERQLTALGFKNAVRRHGGKPTPPVDVKLLRAGPRKMDDEGAIASLKSVRDQIAEELGVDDGDMAKIRFEYGQVVSKPKNWAVYVTIVPRQAHKAPATIVVR